MSPARIASPVSADATPDAATDPTAPVLIRPSPAGSDATAALALVQGTYIFTIGTGVTDLAGNAFVPQEVTIGEGRGDRVRHASRAGQRRAACHDQRA